MVARGFQERQAEILTDTPTCAKESLSLVFSVISSKMWICQSTDIKTAFLQGEEIDREVYIVPPKAAAVDTRSVWRQNKAIYGLQDLSRAWYIGVKNKLLS